MSKSRKKQGKLSLKRDARKVQNRGFRRHVKLLLKDGQFSDLPEAPRKKTVPQTEE